MSCGATSKGEVDTSAAASSAQPARPQFGGFVPPTPSAEEERSDGQLVGLDWPISVFSLFDWLSKYGASGYDGTQSEK